MVCFFIAFHVPVTFAPILDFIFYHAFSLLPELGAIILKAHKRLNIRVLLHVLYHSKIEEVLLLKANHY